MKKSSILIILLASLFLANAGIAAVESFSDGGGIFYTEPLKTVIFRHQHHVDVKKISCDKCHSGLFEMKALKAQGYKDFNMDSLYRGKYCGACHTGKEAFAADTQCARCHIRTTGLTAGHVKGQPPPYKKPVYNTKVLLGKGETKAHFDHEKHLPSTDCQECHLPIFSIKKGSNIITMDDHKGSKYCFGCHDGKKSFSWSECNRCHQDWKTIAQAGFKKDKKEKSSCYKCHTNDREMKSLVKVPEITGEGEG